MNTIDKTNKIIYDNYQLIKNIVGYTCNRKRYLINKDIILSLEDLKQELFALLIVAIKTDISNNIDTQKYTKESSLSNICRFLLNNHIRKHFSQKAGGDSHMLSITDVSEKNFVSHFNESGFRGDFFDFLLSLSPKNTGLPLQETEAFKYYYGCGYTISEVADKIGLSPSTTKRRMDNSFVSFVSSVGSQVSDLYEYNSA